MDEKPRIAEPRTYLWGWNPLRATRVKAESLDDAEEIARQSIHCEHPGLRNHGTLGLVPENLRRPPIPAPNNPTNMMSCSLGHNGE